MNNHHFGSKNLGNRRLVKRAKMAPYQDVASMISCPYVGLAMWSRRLGAVLARDENPASKLRALSVLPNDTSRVEAARGDTRNQMDLEGFT